MSRERSGPLDCHVVVNQAAASRATNQDVTASGGDDAEGRAQAEAFRRLADRTLDASYRLARMILGGRDDAEDAVHDAYLAAWRAWSSLRDPDRFDAWFARILVNTCRNRMRRASIVRVVDLSTDLGSRTPVRADDHSSADRRIDLVAAFEDLGADDRIVLALRCARDLPVEAIARTLDIPAGTVKSRLHYALRRLGAALEGGAAKETLP